MFLLKHAFPFDHRNAGFDDEEYRHRLYCYPDPCEYIHDNENFESITNIFRKNHTSLNKTRSIETIATFFVFLVHNWVNYKLGNVY